MNVRRQHTLSTGRRFQASNITTKAWLAIGSALTMVSVLLWMTFSTNNQTATVTGFSWERHIPWEHLITYHERSRHLPAGARNVSTHRNHVYDVLEGEWHWVTEHSYDIDRWRTQRVETASGQDQNPVWPNMPTPQNARKRQGRPSERYIVHIQTENEQTHNVSLRQDAWAALRTGQLVAAHINGFGVVMKLETRNAETLTFQPLTP